MTWEETIFGNFVDTNPKVPMIKGESYSFIPMENIEPSVKHTVPRCEKEFSSGGARFANGDTLFARITPCLEHGKITKARGLKTDIGFGSTEYIVFRAKDGISDPDFVYYLAKSDVIKQPAIKSMVGSSGRQRAQKEVIENIIINVPKIGTQKHIASILSAYDDLIENNNRRIELLEESARLLYREWFVDFRFPGYEHAEFVDGLPKGWNKVKLGEKIILNYGKALKSEDRINGDYPVFGSSGIVGYHNKFLVNGPGIIVGRKGNVGSIYWSYKNYNPIDTVYYIDSSTSNFYLFQSLQNMQFLSSDAAVPGLNRDYAYSKDYLIPSNKTFNFFNEIVSTTYEQVYKLLDYNQKLKEARDILLPKLMSGEIEV